MDLLGEDEPVQHDLERYVCGEIGSAGEVSNGREWGR